MNFDKTNTNQLKNKSPKQNRWNSKLTYYLILLFSHSLILSFPYSLILSLSYSLILPFPNSPIATLSYNIFLHSKTFPNLFCQIKR